MARQPIWHDEYWLMLIQIYMKKPVGVKPIYSRELVQLGMELHIHPQYLHRMMTKLDEVESPSVKALMDSYAHNPKKFRKNPLSSSEPMRYSIIRFSVSESSISHICSFSRS